jgi:hypothetical protein
LKAITLYQPHAMFVATGWKEVETRDWYTPYRGPLAIHSARRWTGIEETALHRILAETGAPVDLVAQMAFGCIEATCQIVACVRVNEGGFPSVLGKCALLKPPFIPKHGWDVEAEMGNYASGRWAWILRDVVRLPRPITARGYRKIWDWRPQSASASIGGIAP